MRACYWSTSETDFFFSSFYQTLLFFSPSSPNTCPIETPVHHLAHQAPPYVYIITLCYHLLLNIVSFGRMLDYKKHKCEHCAMLTVICLILYCLQMSVSNNLPLCCFQPVTWMFISSVWWMCQACAVQTTQSAEEDSFLRSSSAETDSMSQVSKPHWDALGTHIIVYTDRFCGQKQMCLRVRFNRARCAKCQEKPTLGVKD